MEHGPDTASRHVAAVILLELGTCASHQTDTSGIVQSYNATCLIHKSEIKVSSLQRTGRTADCTSNYPAQSMVFCVKYGSIDCAARSMDRADCTQNRHQIEGAEGFYFV